MYASEVAPDVGGSHVHLPVLSSCSEGPWPGAGRNLAASARSGARANVAPRATMIADTAIAFAHPAQPNPIFIISVYLTSSRQIPFNDL